MKKVILLLALFSVTASAQLGKVVAYHPTWWYGMYRPNMIDYTKMTHLILFGAQGAKTTAPYFNWAPFANTTETADIITRAHAAGTKVLLSVVGGYGEQGMPAVVADPVKTQLFIDSASAFALAWGFDGVECDWEFPRASDEVGWNRFIRLFRNKLDAWPTRGIFATSMFYSIGTSGYSSPYYVDSMVIAFDQINLMSYTMWMGTSESPYYTGFDTPVNVPTSYPGYRGWALNSVGNGPKNFPLAGYPKSKLCIGMAFESSYFIGADSINNRYTSFDFEGTTDDGLSANYINTPIAGRVWDAQAQASYCVTGNNFISFQDTNSVKAITQWAVDEGWGGVMIYDIGAGWDKSPPSGRMNDYLLETVWRTAGATPDTTTDPPAQATSRKYLLRRR